MRGWREVYPILWFPSHLGSLQTDNIIEVTRTITNVSIPPWFASNIYDNNEYIGMLQGFHPTLVRFKLICEHIVALIFENVSIPPWFASNSPGGEPCGGEGEVSIPPWFASNETSQGELGGGGKSFHPTLVRFKHNVLYALFYAEAEFPSHLGSLQTPKEYR